MSEWVIGIIAWLIPGAGHFYLGHWKRGIAISTAVLAMFLVGIILGGTYFPGAGAEHGIIYWLHYFAGGGNAVLFALLTFLSGTPSSQVMTEAAKSATFEYGGKLIEVAGLLNYLAAIDAFDVAKGRKK